MKLPKFRTEVDGASGGTQREIRNNGIQASGRAIQKCNTQATAAAVAWKCHWRFHNLSRRDGGKRGVPIDSRLARATLVGHNLNV